MMSATLILFFVSSIRACPPSTVLDLATVGTATEVLGLRQVNIYVDQALSGLKVKVKAGNAWGVEYSNTSIGCIAPSLETDQQVTESNSLSLFLGAGIGSSTSGCALLPQCAGGAGTTCSDVCDAIGKQGTSNYHTTAFGNGLATTGVCACRVHVWGRKQRAAGNAAPEVPTTDRRRRGVPHSRCLLGDVTNPTPKPVMIDVLVTMVKSILLEAGVSQENALAVIGSIQTLHTSGDVLKSIVLDAQGKLDEEKVIANKDLLNVITAAGVSESQFKEAAAAIGFGVTYTIEGGGGAALGMRAGKAIATLGCGLAITHHELGAATAMCVAAAGLAVGSTDAPADGATPSSCSADKTGDMSLKCGDDCSGCVAGETCDAVVRKCQADGTCGYTEPDCAECADITITVPHIYVGSVTANVTHDAQKKTVWQEVALEAVEAVFTVTTEVAKCDSLEGFDANGSGCSTRDDCDAICNPPANNSGAEKPVLSELACKYTVNKGCLCSSDQAGEYPFAVDKLSAPYTLQCSCVVQDRCQVDGRPFVVDGSARTAPPVHAKPGADDAEASLWSDDLKVGLESTSVANSTRAKIVKHWLEAGAAEHASIASFSRHSLQLMAIGAPPTLVFETHAAGMDEIKHAKMCYGLARSYSGENVGPGKLQIAGAITAADQTLDGVLSSVIREGCLGETSAAFEAHLAAAGAKDTVVKGVLTTIAADEARHAQLGWSFVQWYLSENANGGGTRVVQSLFAKHLGAFTVALGGAKAAAGEAADQAVLLSHGVLTSSLRLRFRAALVEEVIKPMVTLLASAAGASADVDIAAKIQTIAARMSRQEA